MSARIAKATTAELSIVNEAISAPGAAFKRNAVLFEKPLGIEQLNGLAAKVVELGGGTAWWLGDIGLEIQARNRETNEARARGKDAEIEIIERDLEAFEKGTKERTTVHEKIARLQDEARKLRADDGRSYLKGRAELMGIDEGYWANCVMLCRFFAPSQRCEVLTVHHHRAAMIGAGGARGASVIAQKWLAVAKDEKLSAAALRARINESLMDAGAANEPAPEENDFELLDETDKWATRIKPTLQAFSPSKAFATLTRMQAIAELVDLLRERAKGFSP